jgi:hypothetical protein
MAKIKITKKQAMMLENLNTPKILKITESQYKAILEHEGLGEGAVIPQIANSFRGKEKQNYIQNVNSETKIKGVFKESEELWKEFVNELYGLHESGSNMYERLIKLMEACGYVENRKLSKSKFDGDRDMVKNVILGGLNKLHESGSPYMAMEMMENEYEKIKQSLKHQLTQEPTSNTTPEQQDTEIKRRREIELQRRKESGEMTPEAPVNEYGDNSPMGADYNPDAPWNQKDDEYRDKTVNKNQQFNLLANTGESAIFEKDGELYYFYYDNINRDDFMDYADVPKVYTGQDEDGLPDYDYGDWEMDDSTVSNYLNDKVDNLNVGFGYESYENGADFVKMDEPLKSEVMSIFRNNPDVAKALGQSVDEMSMSNSSGQYTTGGSFLEPMKNKEKIYETLNALKKKVIKENDETYNYIADELGLTSDEFDEALNNSMAELDIIERIYFSDSYTNSEKISIIANILKLPHNPQNQTSIEESGGGIGSVGAYDTPGFASSEFFGNAGKKGKAKVNKGVTHKQTMIPGGSFVKENAFDSTQLDGGEMVTFDNCTKLNNNKTAQSGGCSTGAVDNVVKTKKTTTNVSAPSLGKKQSK